MCDINNHIQQVQKIPSMFTSTEVAMVEEVLRLRTELAGAKVEIKYLEGKVEVTSTLLNCYVEKLERKINDNTT